MAAISSSPAAMIRRGPIAGYSRRLMNCEAMITPNASGQIVEPAWRAL